MLSWDADTPLPWGWLKAKLLGWGTYIVRGVPQVELLSWKSANDIAGDGGLEKVTEKEGTGWDTPKDLDEVRGEEG